MAKRLIEVEDADSKMEPLPRLAFEIPEAMTVLRIGKPNLLALIAEGRLRVVRIGGRVIIPRVAIEEFLTSDGLPEAP